MWLGCAVGLVALASVSTDTLESLPRVCLSHVLFDLECLGCGMTRAMNSLLHGDLSEAAAYNWRVFIVAPLLTFVGLRAAWRSRRDAPRMDAD